MASLGKVARNRNGHYACELCDYTTSRKNDFEKHVTTDKHTMLTLARQSKLTCVCGKVFIHKQSLSRHKKICPVKTSQEHGEKPVIQNYPKLSKIIQKVAKGTTTYICDCGRSYKHASGLSKHRAKCLERFPPDVRQAMAAERHADAAEKHADAAEKGADAAEKGADAAVKGADAAVKGAVAAREGAAAAVRGADATEKSIYENREMHGELVNQVLAVAKEPKYVTNNNNINVFLNEKCSDALSIDDFCQTAADNTGGFEVYNGQRKRAGICNIIQQGLQELGTYKRPVHCTDVKRQTLYIKDEGEWSKTDSTKKVGKLVKGVEGTQYDAIREWELAHPNYRKGGRVQDEWLKMVKTLGDPLDEKDISHMSRECSKKTHLDKEGIKEQ